MPSAECQVDGEHSGHGAIRRWWWVVPLLLSAALAGPHLFGERWNADAPYYQAIALRTAREGNWWTLMQGDLPYFNKPPLDFWVHALTVKVFGEVDWAFYLPEAVWYVLTCLLVGSVAARLAGPRAGLLAGTVMALTDDWVWRVSNFRLEFLHTLLLVACVRCWVEAFGLARVEAAPAPAQMPRRRAAWAIAGGMCLGGALMTKPLIALGLPVLGLAWLAAVGGLTRRRAGLLALSAGVAVLAALPWHGAMIAEHGRAFTRAYFVDQSLKRATGELFSATPRPWWWYFGHVVDGDPPGVGAGAWAMWPIYALALAGLLVTLGRLVRRAAGPLETLAAAWTILWLAALSAFVGKQNYYLLSVHPGTAWLGAVALEAVLARVDRSALARGGRVGLTVTAVAGVCVAVAPLATLPSRAGAVRRNTANAERDALAAYLRGRRESGVYNAGMRYQEAGLMYIKSGVWARSLREKAQVPREQAPDGALLLYAADVMDRARDPRRPDGRDEVVFRSPGARYIVVRKR